MQSEYIDRPVEFAVGNQKLFGVMSIPSSDYHTAVIIVVGGPQYRVGSHRQFVLLARYLASHGVLALRYDYAGMGFSEGMPKKYYEVDEDIIAAIDFISSYSQSIDRLYVWGLCDAASAITFVAHADTRINGVILLNPWIRSEESHSKAVLSTYYRDRIFALEVWKDLIRSPKKILNACVSLTSISLKVIRSCLGGNKKMDSSSISVAEREGNLSSAIFKGMSSFKGKICLVISKKDLTAEEFMQEFNRSGWLEDANNQSKTTIHHVEGADHTFSSARWRNQVEKITMDFVSA